MDRRWGAEDDFLLLTEQGGEWDECQLAGGPGGGRQDEEDAHRRTTCEVFSLDPIAVRGYTRFGNDTLVPVAVYP